MLQQSIFAAAAVGASLLFVGNRSLMVSQYKIPITRLPKELYHKRFLLITDLHFCTYGKENRRLLSKIYACKPDYVLIAGDLVTGNLPHKAVQALKFLEALAKGYKIFYSPGNHESYWKDFESGVIEPRAGFEVSKKKAKYSFKEYLLELKRMGVIYLSNEQTLLGHNIPVKVLGLELPLTLFKQKEKDLIVKRHIDRLMGKHDTDYFHILLAHDPFYFAAYVDWGAEFVVSGHVHGGLLRIPKFGGVLSPRMEWFPCYDAGLYHKKNSKMLLSRGLGSHTLPARLFNRPELVVFELVQKQGRNEEINETDGSKVGSL